MTGKVKLISNELDGQIVSMINKIRESFGLTISKIQASKIVAWKSSKYNVPLTEKKLIEILGDGKNVQ